MRMPPLGRTAFAGNAGLRERTGASDIARLRPGDPAVDASGNFRHGAIGSDGDEAIGRALQERTVVAHGDERSGPIVEEVLEDPQGVQIEIVRRLIEEEDVGTRRRGPAAVGAGAAPRPRVFPRGRTAVRR